MNTRTTIGLLVLGSCLAACSTRHSEVARSAPAAKSYANPSGASSERSYGQAAPSPEAPSASADYSAREESEADERPGLGTSWG